MLATLVKDITLPEINTIIPANTTIWVDLNESIAFCGNNIQFDISKSEYTALIFGNC